MLVKDKRPIACADAHGRFVRWFRDLGEGDPALAGTIADESAAKLMRQGDAMVLLQPSDVPY